MVETHQLEDWKIRLASLIRILMISSSALLLGGRFHELGWWAVLTVSVTSALILREITTPIWPHYFKPVPLTRNRVMTDSGVIVAMGAGRLFLDVLEPLGFWLSLLLVSGLILIVGFALDFVVHHFNRPHN